MSEPDSHPDVPPRTMRDDAAGLRELFETLQRAGFSHDESLYLVGFVMVGNRPAWEHVRRLLDS